jgi:ribosomal protein S18 acetylase RimI-like enzyme
MAELDAGGALSAATVRVARAADFDAVLELWERARSAAATTPDDEDVLARLTEHTDDALLVAELDGQIVGALVAAWDGWRGNMYRLAVDPAYRRRGVATALVRAGEERLRALGARRITALVAHGEADAVGLWAAAGYARDEAIARFVRKLD